MGIVSKSGVKSGWIGGKYYGKPEKQKSSSSSLKVNTPTMGDWTGTVSEYNVGADKSETKVGTSVISGGKLVATIKYGSGGGTYTPEESLPSEGIVVTTPTEEIILKPETAEVSTISSQVQSGGYKPQPINVQLSESLQKQLEQEKFISGMPKKETEIKTGQIDVGQIYLQPTVISKITAQIKDPTTGKKVPVVEYSYFDPTGTVSTERPATMEEINQYFPKTEDVGTKQTLLGTISTKAGTLKTSIVTNLGEDYQPVIDNTKVFGEGGYISQGKDALKWKTPGGGLPENKILSNIFKLQGGMIEGLIPETKLGVGVTVSTFGLGAVVGAGTRTTVNIARAYAPKSAPYISKAIWAGGTLAGTIWGTSKTINLVTAPNVETFGERLGATTREGLVFYGGAKVGSSLVQRTPFLKQGVEIVDTKTTKFSQKQKGSLIKSEMIGRAGEYNLFTSEGKPLKMTGEAAVYSRETTVKSETFKPFKRPVVSSITVKEGTAVSTSFGKNIFGAKAITETQFEIKGIGERTSLTLGKQISFNKQGELITKDFLSKEISSITVKAYAEKIGKGLYIQSGTAKVKPLERITYTSGEKEGGEFFLQGKAFGKGIRGRPSIIKGGGFEFVTGRIETPQAEYTFGKSLNIFKTSGRKIPTLFSTITKQPMSSGVEIDYSAPRTTNLFQIQKSQTAFAASKFMKSLSQSPIQKPIQSLKPSVQSASFKTPQVLITKRSQMAVQQTTQSSKTIQKQSTILETSTKQTSRFSQGLISKQQFFQPISFKQSTQTKQLVGTSQTFSPLQTQRQTQTFQITQTPVTIFKTPTPTQSFFRPVQPPVPPRTPPPFFPLDNSRLFSGSRSRAKTSKAGERYSPDLGSIIFGRKGKRPKRGAFGYNPSMQRPIPF